jgi:DNA mismatch repair protein MutH
MSHMVSHLESVDQLLVAAAALRGRHMHLSASTGDKGVAGRWLEQALGAHGGDDVDFPRLGVELKSVPCNALGRVQESTWVCMATPSQLESETWSTSRVLRKLRAVLFVCWDVETATVGLSFLWQPNAIDLRTLQRDWADLSDLVVQGLAEHVRAHRGTWLQLRPKALHSGVRRGRGDDERAPVGFYLRRSLLQTLVDAARHSDKAHNAPPLAMAATPTPTPTIPAINKGRPKPSHC